MNNVHMTPQFPPLCIVGFLNSKNLPQTINWIIISGSTFQHSPSTPLSAETKLRTTFIPDLLQFLSTSSYKRAKYLGKRINKNFKGFVKFYNLLLKLKPNCQFYSRVYMWMKISHTEYIITYGGILGYPFSLQMWEF